jgi:hypothetical protein
VNIGFLAILSTYLGFDITKYRNCFDKDVDPTDLRDITPDDQATILRYLSVLYAKLVNAAQQDQDVKGDILEGLSEPDQVEAALDRPERVAYFACLVTYSILMGKTRAVPGSQVRIVSVVSPLLLWSHEFDAAVLFDGTGALFPYPKDSCILAPPTVPPQPLLHVKTLPISGDKRKHLKYVEQAPGVYYQALRAQLAGVVTALVARYAQVYVCTWRDNESEEYAHHTSRFYSATVEEEQIVRLHNRPQFEIEPLLKVESLLWDMVHELELTERVHVSHYGLSRGSNAFQEYDCVLLVGHFYYPGWKYHHYAAFSAAYSLIQQKAVPTYDANPLPLVLSYLIQECMRVQARHGYPVDCYVCLDERDPDYPTLIDGLSALQEHQYYIRSLAHADLHGRMLASEQQVKLQYLLQACLTTKQTDRMIALVKMHPAFLDERCLTIDTTALGQLWDCRSDEVCPILDSIARRSAQLITYEVLTPGRQGRRSSTQVQLQLRPVS